MKKIFLTLTFTLLFIPFGISQDLPSYVPTDGLVAYYPFNGNANDESGNGNHGTVNGATLTEDRFGNVEQAYTFDGINDFIDISNISGLISSQGISLSIWTKNYNPTSSSNQQFLFLIGSNPNARILMRDESNQVSGSILNCNCSDDLYTSHEINPNQWTNIVLTYNLEIGEQKLYVNGVNVDSKTESMNTYYTTNNIAKRIGSYGFNNHYFNGVLDDASIWNRTLTEQEIQNLYNSSSGDILLNGTVSVENNQIKNVADPTEAQDAVTKSYLQAKIDELILRIENIENGVIPDSPVVFSLGIDSVSGYSTPGNTVTAYAINGDILGTAIAQIESFSNYMILDDFTDRVPTGTNYEKLTFYDTYTDAGSIDGSRFEINRLTTDYGGGILFYGTLELNSQDDKNVFRLSDSDGLPFKFNSFYLNQLESNGTYNFTEFSGTADPGQTVEIYIGGNLFNSTVSDENGEWSIPFDNIPEGSNSIEIIGGVHYGPSLKVTFDNSHEVIFRNELSSIFSFDGVTNLEFFEGFDTSGTKSFNIDKVEWVDFESHYTKAKITDINLDQIDSNFDVSFAPQQTSGSSVLLSSTDEYGTESDKVGVTID